MWLKFVVAVLFILMLVGTFVFESAPGRDALERSEQPVESGHFQVLDPLAAASARCGPVDGDGLERRLGRRLGGTLGAVSSDGGKRRQAHNECW